MRTVLEGCGPMAYGDGFRPVTPTAMTRNAPLEAFARLAARRGMVIASVAVRDREVALDLVQDSLAALLARYADRPETEWAPLFHTILQSRIMDWKRRQARRSRWLGWLLPDPDEPDRDPWQDVPDPSGGDPAQLVERADNLAEVLSALESLPMRQQQAFLLRAWEGLDTAATARAMGCGENSVKTHYARALAALRARLSGQGDTA